MGKNSLIKEKKYFISRLYTILCVSFTTNHLPSSEINVFLQEIWYTASMRIIK